MIRMATPDDAAAIAAIWNPVIRDTAITFNSAEKTQGEVAELIRGKARARHAVFVAGPAGGVAGFASYGQFRQGVGYVRAMEHTILVAPGARGTGLGRALLAAVEQHARSGGAHVLVAGVSAENPAGVSFHARMGFREVARLAQVGWKFGRAIDLVLMQKFL